MSDEEIKRLWKALKEVCCVRPETAVRCVMVTEADFIAAMTLGGDVNVSRTQIETLEVKPWMLDSNGANAAQELNGNGLPQSP